MTLIKSISGIRGTIGGPPHEGLTPVDIVENTAAFGQWLLNNEAPPKVVIGRDARKSGPMIQRLVTGTLQGMGISVIDLGLAPTPTVELAVQWEDAGGGIIITASHNPQQWNALKLLNANGEFVTPTEGEKILRLAEEKDYSFAPPHQLGSVTTNQEAIQKHIDAVLDLPLVKPDLIKKRKFKVVIDCINSVGSLCLPQLLERLGVDEIIKLNCEPDGEFDHNPEPIPENLNTLASQVDRYDAHLGIVVDPDVDRLAFVCEDGSMFGEEYTLVAVADYVLQHKKGAVVSNVSSTQALKDITEKHGGTYHASAVGEVNVVQKMKEVEAVIGGEGNGGVIYPPLHYGRDALVGIGLFLTYLAETEDSISMLQTHYPRYYMTKGKIPLENGINPDELLDRIQKIYKDQPINTEDGVKILFDNEWVHLRKSNTEPVIRVYAEGESETTAQNLSNKLINDMKSIITEVN